MKTFAMVAVLALTLVLGHYWREAKKEIATLRNELQQSQGEVRRLKQDLQDRDAQIQSLQGHISGAEARISSLATEAAGQSADLQKLQEEVNAQRLRTEQKRKEYQAMISKIGVDPALAARLKQLEDDNQQQRNRLTSIQQDETNAGLDAGNARANAKGGSDFSLVQEDSRVNAVQMDLNNLQAQRNSVAANRGDPMRKITLTELDQSIAADKANLGLLKTERNNMAKDIQSAQKTFDSQVHASSSQLKNEENTIKGKIDGNNRQIFQIKEKIGSAQTVSGERKGMLDKLTAELREETDRLAQLERRLSEAKKKVDRVK